MVTKVLFFDTSALLKLFLDETGSEQIKWLCNPETKFYHRLSFVINEQVVSEVLNKKDSFVSNGRVSEKKGEMIKSQFEMYYKDRFFRVIGRSIISNTKSETLPSEVRHILSLEVGKNDWDGRHYESIVNALAYLGGESKPILVSADKEFSKKVGEQGYVIINPLNQSIDEIESLIKYRLEV